MPNLAMLALRYLLWIVALRLLYIGLSNATGLPNTLATTVILAAAPAADIGMQAVRRAMRALTLADWAQIWGLLVAVYLAINVILPAMLVPEYRMALSQVGPLQVTATVSAATAAMLALFLWLGSRIGRNPR